ncbi:MAG TPA: DNA polymerase III subunit delta [Anaerolineales bacterium]|nr:DNA polymerase III subunit delta [Anaerolineae bacterium]HIQ01506.1 DNA polymerase III subunit delta [Anaerolineales bacterium]
MAQPGPTFYVLHGSDEFTRAERVAEFRQRLGPPETADLNTTWLDGRAVTLGDLRHACEAVPFLADRRLVLVTGLLTRLGKGKGQGERAFLEELLDLLPRLPETTRLVFIEEGPLPDSHPVLRLAREHERGYARRFEPPAPKALPQWIVRRVQKYRGRIEPPAAARLAQAVGSDLRLLDQEIRKLITYVGPEGAITTADISRLVPYVQQAVVFDLVDALGRRDGRVAVSTLQRLLDDGESPMGILAMIVRQFRLLIQVKELSQAGENPASIARTLRLHPFPARKLYTQAANFTAAQLERIYRHLLETDLQIKSGNLAVEVALDLLVAGLTGGG